MLLATELNRSTGRMNHTCLRADVDLTEVTGRGLEHTVLDTTGVWETSCSISQPAVDLCSSATAFVDAPDNERLTPSAVARSEHPGNVGQVLLGRCLNIRTTVDPDFQSLEDFTLWSQESECKKDKLSREELFRARDFFHLPPACTVLCPLHSH